MTYRRKEQIGDCTLYLGDCLEVLPTLALGKVDAVVTDPPYGIEHQTNGQIFKSAVSIHGDNSLQAAEDVRAWARRGGTACCMFFSPFRPMGGWRSVLCWSKGVQVGAGGDRETCWKRDLEMIGVENNGPLQGNRDSAVLHFAALVAKPSGHFAEKPVALMEYLVRKLDAQTILDPFMGSGTTLVACAKLGRRGIGIEIEPKYFDIARRRVEAVYREPRLELPEPEKPEQVSMFEGRV